MSHLIHEEQIACVRLQPDVRPTSSVEHPSYLLVLRRNGQPPAVLGDGLPFYPAYHAIRLICSTLATLTVDGQLRVHHRCITPEAYLRRWRKALAQPLTMEQFARQWQVRPVAVIQWPYVPAMAGTRAGWLSPPFATLGELLMHRAHDIDRVRADGPDGPEGHGRPLLTRLQIDLCSANGARDAWWADDFVSRAVERSPAGKNPGIEPVTCTRLELRALPVQPSGGPPRPNLEGVPA